MPKRRFQRLFFVAHLAVIIFPEKMLLFGGFCATIQMYKYALFEGVIAMTMRQSGGGERSGGEETDI